MDEDNGSAQKEPSIGRQGWRGWGTLSLTELFPINRSREWEVIAFHHVPTGDYTIVSIQSNGHTDTSI